LNRQNNRFLSFFSFLMVAALLLPAAPAAAGPVPAVQVVPVIRVPQDVPDLQTAINQVADSGVIELAQGSYPSPQGGFQISDRPEAFTIRAAEGARVVLDGQGQRDILRFINSSKQAGRPVVFKDLIFANGRSSTDGVAPGVTMVRAEGTFINVAFENNAGLQPNSAGGGIVVAVGSVAFFNNCTWLDNTARVAGAGLAVAENSRVYIHASQFINNRTNLPGHSPMAAGGGIHAGNSILRISNSYFENNQAGYVGGGLYVIGTWNAPYDTPRADVIVANSTFVNNKAQRDPGVPPGPPTEAGAVHVEDQALLRVYHSRFAINSAEAGGGVNIYRAGAEIYQSVFQGNFTTGAAPATGFGGAISAISNDVPGEPVNYPPARLLVENTLLHGRYGGVTNNGLSAGGIFAAGDSNRNYGLNGVSKTGSSAENRSQVRLTNVIFHDFRVAQSPGGGIGGHGGALLADLAHLDLENVLITQSEASGASNSSGGGAAVLRDTWASFNNVSWMHNAVGMFGGGLFAQGSHIELNDCAFAGNQNSTQYGSAIFTSPMEETDKIPPLDVRGVVQNCTFSNNDPIPYIFDDDRQNGPINDVVYNDNRFYHADGSSTPVYSNSLATYRSVAQLNDLVIQRSNGTSTDKTQVANQFLGSVPKIGRIMAAPSRVLPLGSVENPVSPQAAYIGYAWSGGSATLNGVHVSGGAGLAAASQAGSYTLNVGGETFTADILLGPAPSAHFQASTSAGSTLISWDLQSGDFLDAAVDQGVSIPSQPSGSVQVISPEQVYSFYAITKQGGVFITADSSSPVLSAPAYVFVLAGMNQDDPRGYVPLRNAGGGTLVWTASTGSKIITLEAGSGETTTMDSIAFRINKQALSLGRHYAEIQIEAGEAGSQTVQVEILLVEHVYTVTLPLLQR
jgi:hypothetical protein